MTEQAAVVEQVAANGEIIGTPSIWRALSDAQAEFPTIKKNRTAHVKSKTTGVEFEYQYCTLDAILEAVRPPLNKHGLVFRHELSYEGCIWIEAILTHVSGDEVRSGKLPVPHCDGDMQALGSGLTYSRRYTANAILGICPEEDDDARLAGPNPFRKEKEAPRQTKQEGAQAATDQAKRKLNHEEILARIGSFNTAKGLADFLLDLVGKLTVAKFPDRFKAYGVAAKHRIDARVWPEDHDKIVHAVLDTIRAQLMAPVPPPPPAPLTTAAEVVPTFDSLKRYIDSMLVPADLQAWFEGVESGEKPLARAILGNSELWKNIVAHAVESVHQRCESQDDATRWTVEQAEPVGTYLSDLKDKLELNSQMKEACDANEESSADRAD